MLLDQTHSTNGAPHGQRPCKLYHKNSISKVSPFSHRIMDFYIYSPHLPTTPNLIYHVSSTPGQPARIVARIASLGTPLGLCNFALPMRFFSSNFCKNLAATSEPSCPSLGKMVRIGGKKSGRRNRNRSFRCRNHLQK